MDIDTFFSIFHDRMMPQYVRNTIDSTEINLDSSLVISAAKRLFSENSVAGI